MSQCLDKLSHHCGTRSGLQVFAREDGGVDGYCFSCSELVRHPYGAEKLLKDLPQPKVKTPEEISEEIAEISGYPTVTIHKKRLKQDSLELFNVRVGLSEKDGKTPTMLCYPYYKQGILTGYKIKLLDSKKIWSVGDIKGSDFFGWDYALSLGARRLVITEGEDDAISLRKCIIQNSNEGWKDFIAVVSLPTGISGARDFIIERAKELRANFKQIILCFDEDKAGQRGLEEVIKYFPDFHVMHTPSKDANQSIIDGKSKALYNAVRNFERPKNTRLVFGEDIHARAKKPPTYGELSWPWRHLQEATRGIRYGETIYLGAAPKMGKSEIVNALAVHFITEHNVPVFMAKPEEVNDKTYKMLLGKVEGKFFHDPTKPFDEEAYDRAGEVLVGKLAMIDLYQHIGWESLKADIYAAASWGAKAIFIDPITNLTAGMPTTDANTHLDMIAQELSVMAKDCGFVAFIFCHLNSNHGNIGLEQRERFYAKEQYVDLGQCPHGLGGSISSDQFTGSRAMMRKCNVMIGMEGNKDPNLEPRIRNIRHLKVLEEREFGASGVYPIYWNENTSLYREA